MRGSREVLVAATSRDSRLACLPAVLPRPSCWAESCSLCPCQPRADGSVFLDALFTATSAVCVTGLTVRDTANDFSTFGHAVILALIQLGGLGITTLSTALFLLFGQRASLCGARRRRRQFPRAAGGQTEAFVGPGVRVDRRDPGDSAERHQGGRGRRQRPACSWKNWESPTLTSWPCAWANGWKWPACCWSSLAPVAGAADPGQGSEPRSRPRL